MFLDFLEKRSEEVDDTPRLTDEEKLFLKVFGIEEDQPAAAMKEATYFTCIKKLSEAVAKTPLYLTQDTETGERRAKEHPLYELLSLRPNPYMTAVDFWKAIEATRQHEGIAGAVKVYGRKGKIEALYPCTIEGITIDDAGVLRSTKKHKVLVDFKVPGTGMNESAFYEDLLIFKGFTMDGINTEAVRTIVKSTIDVQIKAQNYLNTLFDNGLTNKMVIQLTSDIRDEKELKKIQEKFGKLYSKGKRIFTVPAGFNVQPVNLSLADAQYEQMAWAQEESSGATSYDTILCYSRANSIYTEKGLHFGCNVYAHGWNLYNADLRNTSYDGYSSWTGEIPIITKIQANSDGTITWWSSSITVRNGGITSAPRS